jgi:SAM-dependent methyltransferase
MDGLGLTGENVFLHGNGAADPSTTAKEEVEQMRPRDEIAAINQQHWGRVAAEDYRPSLDLDPTPIRDYGAGRTEQAPARLVDEMYPADVLAGVAGKAVLCLAASGGHQTPFFGLLGARVTVVDLTEGQLEHDRTAAAHYGYEVRTIQGDMRDLSELGKESFDLVWQQRSMASIPEVREVYAQVAGVLRPDGTYRVDFTNPAVEFAHEEWDGVGYRITRPYKEKVRHTPGEAIEFRHYLRDIFGGLLAAGFSIQRVEEEPGFEQQDPTLEPGSWEHSLEYLVGFVMVARKETGRE